MQARNQHQAGITHTVTLKKEAACSSETSVNFERYTRHYIPEGINLQIKLIFLNSFSPVSSGILKL
jgi:hypothetical protein